MPARLIIERTGQGHSSVWLKAVQAVDLEVHCINSLIGERVPVDRDSEYQSVSLDPWPAPAYYLCAVSHPYNWSRNSHVLAVPDSSQGGGIEVEQPGLRVSLFGLRPVEIRLEWITDPGRYERDRLFVTCRNLMAATWLHEAGGLDDRPNPERQRYRRGKPRTSTTSDAPTLFT